MVSINSNCLSFKIILSLLHIIKQSSTFVIPPQENKIEVIIKNERNRWFHESLYLQLYDVGDAVGVPIVRFLPRREGEIRDEVFVKPEKVKNVIPVIDSVGVQDHGKSTFFESFLSAS